MAHSHQQWLPGNLTKQMGTQAITDHFGNKYVKFLAKDFPDMDTPAVRRFCLYGFKTGE